MHPDATLKHSLPTATMMLTPREAAFVAERDVRTVQRAIHAGIVQKRTSRAGQRTMPILARPELRFFGALRGNEDVLTPVGRQKLYEAVQHPEGGKAAFGMFVVDMGIVDHWIDEAARAYPSLPRETIEAAVQYAHVYPKKGRPYPAASMKRMLSELALPGDVFDVPVDESSPSVVRL